MVRSIVDDRVVSIILVSAPTHVWDASRVLLDLSAVARVTQGAFCHPPGRFRSDLHEALMQSATPNVAAAFNLGMLRFVIANSDNALLSNIAVNKEPGGA
jgi:hypothetical protein